MRNNDTSVDFLGERKKGRKVREENGKHFSRRIGVRENRTNVVKANPKYTPKSLPAVMLRIKEPGMANVCLLYTSEGQ